MQIIKLTFNQPIKRHRAKVVEIPVSDRLNMEDLKRLWEFELFINSLPGCPVRLHLEVNDAEHTQ